MVHFRRATGCDYVLIFNFVLLGIGVFLIAFGFSIFIIPYELENFRELITSTSIATDKLVILGVLIFSATFFGGLSIITNGVGFLKWYAVCILALITLQAFTGFYTFFIKVPAENEIEKILEDALHKYDVGHDNFIDTLQIKFRCCGISSPSDWVQMNLTIPQSCCETKVEPCDTGFIFQNGCLCHVLRGIEGGKVTLIWIIFTVIAIELLITFITLFVRESIRYSHEPV